MKLKILLISLLFLNLCVFAAEKEATFDMHITSIMQGSNGIQKSSGVSKQNYSLNGNTIHRTVQTKQDGTICSNSRECENDFNITNTDGAIYVAKYQDASGNDFTLQIEKNFEFAILYECNRTLEQCIFWTSNPSGSMNLN